MRAGVWTLTEALGRGGMAEVWRGEADDSPDVAIKLLLEAPNQGVRFDAEAAALARLVHPRIIRILDFGTTTVGLRHVPFLALELARGPSLQRWFEQTALGWNDVLDVARRILEGLAHAHSRGLVHRDIKPANVLAMDVAGRDWRLTDFGIAQSDTSVDERNPSGTPLYMAPEQFRGRGRDQGPWTDLYSLGCVLYEILAGAPPFYADLPLQYAFKHLSEPAPLLKARMDVPEGTDVFLSVLLRKDPLSRFRHAADALRALEKLPKLRSSRSVAALPAGEAAETYVTPAFAPTLLLGDLDDFEWRLTSEDDAPDIDPLIPPDEPPDATPGHYFSTFHGDTGLGLVGLRELPFVGRYPERRSIWAAMRDAVLRRERRAVLVHGGPGIGKSAVCRWLTQTVAEHGMATSIWIAGDVGVESACVEAVRSTYRLHGLSGADAADRLRRWANPPAWAVDNVVRGLDASNFEQVDIIGSVLAVFWAHAERRPVVLSIDDADRDPSWLAFAQRVVNVPYADVPVFVIATATERGRVEGVDVEVELGPFGAGECTGFVRELLGLAPEQAFAIAQAVEGNPGSAVEVVTDWIDRGLLIRVAGNWALRGGRLPPLPASVGAMRTQQYETLVGADTQDRDAMELLSVYGPECPEADWELACGFAGLEPSGTLLLRAVRAGVLRPGAAGLRFADAILRSRVMASAEQRAVKVRFHRAIARVIGQAPERYPPALVGVHLFEAGQYEEALSPLLDAARHGGYAESRESDVLLDYYERAIAQLEAEDSELAWWGRYTRADLQSRRWGADQARAALREVIDVAGQQGWPALECDAITSYTTLVSSRSPDDEDARIAAYGATLSDLLEDPRRRSAVRNAAGALFGYQGRLDEAFRSYSEARAIAAAAQDPSEVADADYGLGWVHFLRGDLNRALPPLRAAIAALDELGRISSSNAVRSFTGDVYRALGQLDDAEAVFTEAYHYFSRYYILDAVMPANFAMLEIARGRIDLAVRWARRAREIEQTRGRPMVIALTWATELLAAAHAEDAEAWDESFRQLVEGSGSGASYDVAYITDVAARETTGRLDAARTGALLQLAIEFWRRLDRSAEVAALHALMASEP